MKSDGNVKKVIFFIPTLCGGGAERIVSELSSNMPGSVEQHIVLFENKVGYPHKAGIVVLGVDGFASKNILFKAIQIFRRSLKFRKVVREIKPDIVFSFLQANITNMLVRLSLPGEGYMAILSERTAPSKIDLMTKGIYGFLNRAIMRPLYNRSSGIISVSEGIKEDLAKNFNINRDKIKVIFNPVDPAKINRSAEEAPEHPWFTENAIPVIINVGRLTGQKDQKSLLKAFREVRNSRVCRLAIIGEGELREDLERLAISLGIAKDVRFLGFQENPFKYIARSGVFVLSSVFEGFPNALVEAMALGCPVIASDCPTGPREILAPPPDDLAFKNGICFARYGLLFKPSDVKAMASGINILLGDATMRAHYSEMGKCRVKDFEVRKTVDAYMNALTGGADVTG